MAGGATLRRRLVGELEGKGLLRDPKVRGAFLAVPRELFVPDHATERGLEAVYRDEAILTKRTKDGLGLSSSSQPGIMAEMLDDLRLEPGQRVLEIGAGTGYNAALLAAIVGEAGRVVSVDIDPETARSARRALREAGARARVVTGDGRRGYAAGAPYDRIVVTASAGEIPVEWRDQLAPGGLLEVPIRLRGSAGLQLIPTLRRENGVLRSISVTCGGFMPVRAAPDDLSPYWPMLTVTKTIGAERTPLLALAGEFVRALSPGAARALVATACSEPRRRRLGVRVPTKALAVYLAVHGPPRRLVAAFDGREYCGGIVGREGSSLALLRGWRTTSRMLVYGGDEAADALERLLDDWRERGRPGVDDVALTVSFRNGHSTITTRWRGR